MKTIKKEVELFVQLQKYDWEETPRITLSMYGMESTIDCTVKTLGMKMVEVELDANIIESFALTEIEQLEQLKSKVQAAAHIKVQELQDKLDSLKALENKNET